MLDVWPSIKLPNPVWLNRSRDSWAACLWQMFSSWWFQPNWKIWVKLDHLRKEGWKWTWNIFETTTKINIDVFAFQGNLQYVKKHQSTHHISTHHISTVSNRFPWRRVTLDVCAARNFSKLLLATAARKACLISNGLFRKSASSIHKWYTKPESI